MVDIAPAIEAMREFDKGAARIFETQPFNRITIAKAFERGFNIHSDYSRKVCRLVEITAQLDALERKN